MCKNYINAKEFDHSGSNEPNLYQVAADTDRKFNPNHIPVFEEKPDDIKKTPAVELKELPESAAPEAPEDLEGQATERKTEIAAAEPAATDSKLDESGVSGIDGEADASVLDEEAQ